MFRTCAFSFRRSNSTRRTPYRVQLHGGPQSRDGRPISTSTYGILCIVFRLAVFDDSRRDELRNTLSLPAHVCYAAAPGGVDLEQSLMKLTKDTTELFDGYFFRSSPFTRPGKEDGGCFPARHAFTTKPRFCTTPRRAPRNSNRVRKKRRLRRPKRRQRVIWGRAFPQPPPSSPLPRQCTKEQACISWRGCSVSRCAPNEPVPRPS